MKKGLSVLAFALLFAFGVPSAFATGITIESATYHTYQQTTNNPCVIGNPSCNQPDGFTYTVRTAQPAGNGGTYDLYSPIYIVGSGIGSGNVIPGTFFVGVDDNYSGGQGFENLLAFNVYIGTTPSSFPGEGGASPPAAGFSLDAANSWSGLHTINVSNGNGYADAILSGFSLSAGTYVYFEAIVSNDTDGFEQFFLVPEGTPPVAVPEPTTIVLMGAGLLALAGFARRRRG